jgi:hypothetical protein
MSVYARVLTFLALLLCTVPEAHAFARKKAIATLPSGSDARVAAGLDFLGSLAGVFTRSRSGVDRLRRALFRSEDELASVKAARARLEATLRLLDARLAESALQLPCTRGCSACCHEAVFLSAPEFRGVVDALSADLPPTDFRQLVDDMLAIAARFEDELELLELLEPGARQGGSGPEAVRREG